jgi:hypothetical protein
MRIWTEKERKKQACVARRNRPWKNSTGPKTAAGKYRSSRNALKSGFHRPELKALARLLGLSPGTLQDLLVTRRKNSSAERTEQKQNENKDL